MNQVIKHGRASRMTSFRSDSPLSDDLIRQVAPSVFATDKHHSRADSYKFVNTADVLTGLRDEGFLPYEVRQTITRKEDKQAFAKHMLRLRHPDASNLVKGIDYPEIILVNSHDGTSSYQLIAGWFRMICSNGLVSGTIDHDIKLPHRGKIVDNVIEGAFKVVDDMERVARRVEIMRDIHISDEEHIVLADVARQLRWKGSEHIPVSSEMLVSERRDGDRLSDLWTRFNVIQENLIKGGLAGKSATGRNVSTRYVKGVNENLRINRDVWRVADLLADLKMGAESPEHFRSQFEIDAPELKLLELV